MLDLGIKAKDKITGFEGVITIRSQYLDGTAQYYLESQVKDGKSHAEWLTEGRLLICDDATA